MEGFRLRVHWLTCLALVLGVLNSQLLQAQSLAEPAVRVTKVSGFVTDNAGGSIPQATVTFKAKRFQKNAITARDGHYEIELPEGIYEVIARFPGCKDFGLKKWSAQSNQASTLSISLHCPATPID
jgi:hypothetical protein